jgi:murein DD-endopeptidase MepM/ murein hydrolase activator NlpD
LNTQKHWDQFTILLVPHPRGERREWIVSRRAIRIAAGAMIFVVALTGFLGINRYLAIIKGLHVAKLRIENHELRSDLTRISKRLSDNESRLATLNATDQIFRIWAEIPEVNKEMRQLGVGGGSDAPPTWEGKVSGAASELLANSYISFNRLERESQFLEDSFSSIEHEMEQDEAARDHTPSILPVPPSSDYYVSDGYGYRADPYTGQRRFHRGVDIAGHSGTDILATAAGVVEKVERDRRIGNYLTLDHGHGFRTVYGHLLRKPTLKVGQKVRRGDVIGLLGNTGRSTGPHVHYAVHRNGQSKDPFGYIFNNRKVSSPYAK